MVPCALIVWVGRVLVLLVMLGGPAIGGEDDGKAFPRGLVAWTPIAANPVFQGAGDDAWDRKVRERGYILVEDGTYHLWYTGYNDDRAKTMSLGHATSPDGLRWTRDPANPIFHESWVEDVCVVHQDGRFVMFAEGKGDIAHQLDLARRPPLGRPRVRSTSVRPPAPRSAPALTARRPPGSRTERGTSSTSGATWASGSPPRRTAASGPTSRTPPSWRWGPSRMTATPLP